MFVDEISDELCRIMIDECKNYVPYKDVEKELTVHLKNTAWNETFFKAKEMDNKSKSKIRKTWGLKLTNIK